MFCIFCKNQTKVTNSRSSKKTASKWRRRQCLSCKKTFSTKELPDINLSVKVKSGTTIKPFLDDKLFLSITNALSHRKDRLRDSRELTDTVISKLLPFKNTTVDRKEIIDITYTVIRRFDNAGAVYYKSHHPIN